jgi:hypothetical protein
VDRITFLGALAGANTSAKWLTVDSDGASKIVIEAPASELAQVMRLATKTKSLLRFAIETEPESGSA